MSNLLLLTASAFAQTSGCEPNPANLVALPGAGDTDVPPLIVPFILFDDPCQVDLRIEVTAGTDNFPMVSDTVLRASYAGNWRLAPNTPYTAALYTTETEAELVRWDFTTGDREPTGIRSPSAVSLVGWTEEVDGQLTQFVQFDVNVVETGVPGVVQFHSEDGRKLFAATREDTGRLRSDEPLSYPIGYSESEFCLYFIETDEQGTSTSDLKCGRNGDNPNLLEETGCSTASGATWLAWLPLLALSRRRAARG